MSVRAREKKRGSTDVQCQSHAAASASLARAARFFHCSRCPAIASRASLTETAPQREIPKPTRSPTLHGMRNGSKDVRERVKL